MYKLGKKSKCFGVDKLRFLTRGKLDSMPVMKKEESLVCELKMGFYEELWVVKDKEDIHRLWDSYAAGYALDIKWYLGEFVGFIIQ